MSEARIESARDFAARHESGAFRDGATAAVVRARDEQIAAVAIGLAEKAEREAKARDSDADAIYKASNEDIVTADADERDAARRCEGQASAFRAIAAMLTRAT